MDVISRWSGQDQETRPAQLRARARPEYSPTVTAPSRRPSCDNLMTRRPAPKAWCIQLKPFSLARSADLTRRLPPRAPAGPIAFALPATSKIPRGRASLELHHFCTISAPKSKMHFFTREHSTPCASTTYEIAPFPKRCNSSPALNVTAASRRSFPFAPPRRRAASLAGQTGRKNRGRRLGGTSMTPSRRPNSFPITANAGNRQRLRLAFTQEPALCHPQIAPFLHHFCTEIENALCGRNAYYPLRIKALQNCTAARRCNSFVAFLASRHSNPRLPEPAPRP